MSHRKCVYGESKCDMKGTNQHLEVKSGTRAHWRANYRSPGQTLQPSSCWN